MPPPIRPHTSTLASLRSLRRILTRGAQRKLLLATIGSVVIGVLDSLAVALVLPIVDLATNSGLHSTPVRIAKDVFGTSNTDTLKLLLSVSLVLLFVLKDLGSIWFNWWAQTFTNAERVQVSARILERYLTLPYTVMARRSAAELMRTMDASVLQVFTYTITGIISFVVAFFALVTILTALLLLAPLPTLGLIVYFGLASWVYLRMVRGPAALAGQRMNESSRHGWRTELHPRDLFHHRDRTHRRPFGAYIRLWLGCPGPGRFIRGGRLPGAPLGDLAARERERNPHRGRRG
jgi:ABC-type multidrug transport system fused ATPase/permease subunit